MGGLATTKVTTTNTGENVRSNHSSRDAMGVNRCGGRRRGRVTWNDDGDDGRRVETSATGDPKEAGQVGPAHAWKTARVEGQSPHHQ